MYKKLPLPLIIMKRHHWQTQPVFVDKFLEPAYSSSCLEESSSEVTSSSNTLGISACLSPNSINSPDYGDQDIWHNYNNHNTNSYHQKYKLQINNHHNNHHENGHQTPYEENQIQTSSVIMANHVIGHLTGLQSPNSGYTLPSANSPMNGNGLNGSNGINLNHLTPRSDSVHSPTSSGELSSVFRSF